jgi:hypothetical protein
MKWGTGQGTYMYVIIPDDDVLALGTAQNRPPEVMVAG